ncbi:abortive infection protein [Desulfuromonas soudanensis]|uniref:Abortive infection protein n=1 Tax=Desulfuromonas soudanensis TaxID=1603606 RepID=A0A0M4D741_9BACT|nr:CAAX prenyl protease-related protein [Desulfuromonas soudanensis]ALC16885.1 abortive infection protein [Desulfuromonas soudanensis]
MTQKAFPRIIPFALFMSFIAIEQTAVVLRSKGWLPLEAATLTWLYPLKALAVALALFLLRKHYDEWRFKDFRRLGHTALSIGVGALIFFLWIHMDCPVLSPSPPPGYNPDLIEDSTLRIVLIGSRLFGAVLVVPVMEELFWRSFLLRYLIDKDFGQVAVGLFTWPSFLITALLFGLEHHYILAGVMAGFAFNLLLYHTRSIAQCTLSHAVANLALGIYVLQGSRWHFW